MRGLSAPCLLGLALGLAAPAAGPGMAAQGAAPGPVEPAAGREDSASVAPAVRAGDLRGGGAAAGNGAEAEAAYRRGIDLLSVGSPREAVSRFELALARGYRPAAEAYLQLGLAHARIPLHRLRAVRAFRAALRENPGSPEILYEFADTYLALDGWEGQREARRALIQILAQEPLYRDAFPRWQALYPYVKEQHEVAAALRQHTRELFDPRVAALAARIYVQLGQVDSLQNLLQDWRAGEPRRGTAYHYYRARMLFLQGLPGEATRSFHEGLEAARGDNDLEPYWEDLEPLLDPHARAVAEARTLGGKVAFIRAFWEERDPLPFSRANERLAEQYQRVAEVRKRFLWKKPLAKEKVIGAYVDDLGRPSFDTRAEGLSVDDRGTIYLRHGEPDWRQLELGGGEYWRYDRPGLARDRLQFHFKRMEGPMARGNDVVYSILPSTEVGLANVRQGHAGSEGVENTIWGMGTDTYAFDYGEKVFPLAVSGATFRNRESPGRTDLLLAVGVPLAAIREHEGEADVELVQQLRLYDAEFREELTLRDTLRPARGEDRVGALVGAFQISSYPGERRYAIQIESPRSRALGLQRGEMTFPSYAVRGLQLSDVVFASRVAPAEADPRAPEREGFAIRPLLGRGFARTAPLYLYYEIYDLQAASDGRTRYRVEYRVAAETPVDPGLLRRIFGGEREGEGVEGDEVSIAFPRERPGAAERVPETISLDLSALPSGRYRVAVSVMDQTTGKETSRIVVLDLREGEEE